MAGKTRKQSGKNESKSGANRDGGKPILLAGGNPQIAKADGDAPVQAYIAAMPGWKHDAGRRLDESEHEEVRYVHIHEGDRLDEAQLADWVKQAGQLPGWKP